MSSKYVWATLVAGMGVATAVAQPLPAQQLAPQQLAPQPPTDKLFFLENLPPLPAKGATIVALPVKIRGGSGGPLRIVALVP